MSDGRAPFYVVGEDEVHRALAMALTDASITMLAHEQDFDWLEAGSTRRWSAWEEHAAVLEGRRFSRLKDAPSEFRFHPILDGQRVPPGVKDLRNAILHTAKAEPRPALIILLKDTDGDQELPVAARQVAAWAAKQEGLPPIVIGTPAPEAEAWLLARRALSPTQQRRREKARRALGFDPTSEPERLTSRPNTARTDCKRVLRFILLEEGEALRVGHPSSSPPSNDEPDRLARELAAELGQLGDRVGCGLATFLTELPAGLKIALHDHLGQP